MFRRRGFQRLLRRRFVVHTKDGKSLQGILVGDYVDVLVFAQPEFLKGDQPVDLGGEIAVPRENVSWLQDLTNVVRDGGSDNDG